MPWAGEEWQNWIRLLICKSVKCERSKRQRLRRHRSANLILIGCKKELVITTSIRRCRNGLRRRAAMILHAERMRMQFSVALLRQHNRVGMRFGLIPFNGRKKHAGRTLIA